MSLRIGKDSIQIITPQIITSKKKTASKVGGFKEVMKEKSEDDQIKQIGNKLICCRNIDNQTVRQITAQGPIQELIKKLQVSLLKFKCMSLFDVLNYGCLYIFNKYFQNHKKFTHEHAIYTLIKSLAEQTPWTKESIETLGVVCKELAGSEREICTVLAHLVGYLKKLKDKELADFSKHHIWRVTIRELNLSHFIGSTHVNDTEIKELHTFSASFLPIILNTFSKMLERSFEISSEMDRKFQIYLSELTYEMFLKKSLMTKEGLFKSACSYPEFLKCISIHDKNTLMIVNPQVYRQVMERLLPHRLPCNLTLVLNRLNRDYTSKSIETRWAVDVQRYLKTFSTLRLSKAFDESTDQNDVNNFACLQQEIQELSNGVKSFVDTIILRAPMCKSNVLHKILFGTYFAQGDKDLPEDFLEDFERILENYSLEKKIDAKDFLAQNPTEEVLKVFKEFQLVANNFFEINKNILDFLTLIKLFNSTFNQSCQSYIRHIEENNFDKKRREDLEVELIQMTKTKRKRRRKKKPPIEKRINQPSSNIVQQKTLLDTPIPNLNSEELKVNPIQRVLDVLFISMSKAKFKNPFAKKAWQSSQEIYKDLIAQILDDQCNPEKANRLIILCSLLIEQILTTHRLESQNPNKYEYWELLEHDALKLFENSSLKTKFSDLETDIKDIGDLEIFNRKLYSSAKGGVGAKLLLDIEQWRCTNQLSEELMNGVINIIQRTFSFLKIILNDGKLTDLDCLKEVSFSFDPVVCSHSKLETEILNLLSHAVNSLKDLVSVPEIEKIGNEVKFNLANAERLLDFMQMRIESGLTDGNIRNYYKVLASSLPLAIEEICTALSILKNQRFDNLKPHNLVEMSEQLDVRMSSEVLEYLYSANKLRNLCRYVFYENHQSSESMVKQLSNVNGQINISLDSNSGNWTLQPTEIKKLRRAVNDLLNKTKVGLIHLHELLKLLKA